MTVILLKRVEKLVWDAGIENINAFVGGLSRSQLAVYHSAADVCVIPSHYNPSGMTAMDAMASGTTVIATNLGGLKYVVEHKQNGLLFPDRNSFLLTKAISHLLTEPELRSQMGLAARERVSELFTWNHVASQLNELYLEQIRQQNLDSLTKSWRYSMPAIGA
ncbi:MAG: glycosyltransferase [Cyanobacteria bacterium J06629_2]